MLWGGGGLFFLLWFGFGRVCVAHPPTLSPSLLNVSLPRSGVVKLFVKHSLLGYGSLPCWKFYFKGFITIKLSSFLKVTNMGSVMT